VSHPHIKPDDLDAFSTFAPELARMFAALDGDIVLIVGQDGVIQNVAVSDGLTEPSAGTWIGRHWTETVTGNTRRKIELLLQEVDSVGVTRRREVNHQSSGGPDIPVSYSALRLGKQGPFIAVGRDLRAVAAIQQQMVGAQRELERSYWTLRRDQGQQRELDQIASDATLLVTGSSLHITESNAAAELLLVQTDGGLCLQMQALLGKAIHSGRAVEIRTRLKAKGAQSPLLDLFVTPMRSRGPADDVRRLLVRARRVGHQEVLGADICTVITDTQGRILMANDAFVALCAYANANAPYGKSLSQLLDNAQGTLAGLPSQVQLEGLIHIPSAILGGHGFAAFEAELSASLIHDGDQERIGFCLRVQSTHTTESWAQTLESLLVSGRPLADLLQQVQVLTERRAVSDALRSTGANMVASAKLLGISVDSLKHRLERLGIDRAQYTAH
jgi:transcriptional regulator PpsR